MGKVVLVGIGPGDPAHMTPAAEAAISGADVLCGYTLYLDLLRERFPDKETFSTPMRRETERCRRAVELAQAGKNVAMLCSGDAGVYGMAAPILALSEGTDVEIEVVPGITAALSGAAVLGAPLTNDFCVISLSDHLTPWETIERRLRSAAAGDFSIVLYNPRSKQRPDHLRRACEVLLELKSPDTVCGWVRNIGREGQESKIMPLSDLGNQELDMFCTVFVGASVTRRIGAYMVTPRGYDL